MSNFFFLRRAEITPGHLQPKTLVNSFSALNIAIVHRNGPLFVGFLQHKYIFCLKGY